MASDIKVLMIKKVYPLASELGTVNNNIKCLEEGCDSCFTSESNLSMHMLKCHEKKDLPIKTTDNFIYHHHCPDTDCVYHALRHFKKMKYLKQHYLKVHAEKSFLCETCNKGFATQAIKNTHSDICGINFTCLDCTKKYPSYESLLTHSRRKKHRIVEKSAFSKKLELNKSPSQPIIKDPIILPKHSTSMQTIQFVPIFLQVKDPVDLSDKEIQTEPSTNVRQKIRSVKRRSNCTQTCNKKKVRISAETQTTGDCILKKATDLKWNIDLDNKGLVRKSSETQTKTDIWGENSSTQTGTEDLQSSSSITLDSMKSEDIISSGSQTSLNFFEDTFGNCQETQTDLLYQDDFLHTPNYIAHIETQTNDDIDLCTNMYTQTCDDQLLSDFGFSDIQTQTTWPDYDLFVSTETQTLLTQNTKCFFDLPINGREISHMETQTDMEFKQLLEEINA